MCIFIRIECLFYASSLTTHCVLSYKSPSCLHPRIPLKAPHEISLLPYSSTCRSRSARCRETPAITTAPSATTPARPSSAWCSTCVPSGTSRPRASASCIGISRGSRPTKTTWPRSSLSGTAPPTRLVSHSWGGGGGKSPPTYPAGPPFRTPSDVEHVGVPDLLETNTLFQLKASFFIYIYIYR